MHHRTRPSNSSAGVPRVLRNGKYAESERTSPARTGCEIPGSVSLSLLVVGAKRRSNSAEREEPTLVDIDDETDVDVVKPIWRFTMSDERFPPTCIPRAFQPTVNLLRLKIEMGGSGRWLLSPSALEPGDRGLPTFKPRKRQTARKGSAAPIPTSMLDEQAAVAPPIKAHLVSRQQGSPAPGGFSALASKSNSPARSDSRQSMILAVGGKLSEHSSLYSTISAPGMDERAKGLSLNERMESSLVDDVSRNDESPSSIPNSSAKKTLRRSSSRSSKRDKERIVETPPPDGFPNDEEHGVARPSHVSKIDVDPSRQLKSSRASISGREGLRRAVASRGSNSPRSVGSGDDMRKGEQFALKLMPPRACVRKGRSGAPASAKKEECGEDLSSIDSPREEQLTRSLRSSRAKADIDLKAEKNVPNLKVRGDGSPSLSSPSLKTGVDELRKVHLSRRGHGSSSSWAVVPPALKLGSESPGGIKSPRLSSLVPPSSGDEAAKCPPIRLSLLSSKNSQWKLTDSSTRAANDGVVDSPFKPEELEEDEDKKGIPLVSLATPLPSNDEPNVGLDTGAELGATIKEEPVHEIEEEKMAVALPTPCSSKSARSRKSRSRESQLMACYKKRRRKTTGSASSSKSNRQPAAAGVGAVPVPMQNSPAHLPSSSSSVISSPRPASPSASSMMSNSSSSATLSAPLVFARKSLPTPIPPPRVTVTVPKALLAVASESASSEASVGIMTRTRRKRQTEVDSRMPVFEEVQPPPFEVKQSPAAFEGEQPRAVEVEEPSAVDLVQLSAVEVLEPAAVDVEQPLAVDVDETTAVEVDEHAAAEVEQPLPTIEMDPPPATEVEPPSAIEIELSPAVEVESPPTVEVDPPPSAEDEPRPAIDESPPAVLLEVSPAVEIEPPAGDDDDGEFDELSGLDHSDTLVEQQEEEGELEEFVVETVDDCLRTFSFPNCLGQMRKCCCGHDVVHEMEIEDELPSVSYCEAMDDVSGILVGCTREVDDTLVRPAYRHPYLHFCSMHQRRLKQHLCCPLCGVFCTQGQFMVCEAEANVLHAFHEKCARKFFCGSSAAVVCPHCVTQPAVFKLRKWRLAFNPLASRHDARRILLKPMEPSALRSDEKPDLDWRNSGKVLPEIMEKVSHPMKPSLKDVRRCRKAIESIRKKPNLVRPINLHAACTNGQVENIYRLLKFDANVNEKLNGQSAAHVAAANGQLVCLAILHSAYACLDMRDDDLNTPLMLAARNDHVDCVVFLMQKGCSPYLKGKEGKTPLHFAARNGCLLSCQAILAAAENPSSLLNIQDDGGWTPIVWSAEFGSLPILKYFLALGADHRVRDLEGNTTLHWGAFSGSSPVVETLLKAGSPVDSQNYSGDTALHIAARRDHEEVALLLLGYGASLEVRNGLGETPRQTATLLKDSSNIHALVGLTAFVNEGAVDVRGPQAGKLVREACMRRDPVVSRAAVEVFRDVDVSNGQELHAVSWFNSVDGEAYPKSSFVYSKLNVDLWRISPVAPSGNISKCGCVGNCLEGCACSGDAGAYDSKGRCLPHVFDQEFPLIVECGRLCRCDIRACKNRVVRRGIGGALQVFKTETKGWGVRPVQAIPSRSFVCLYAGELLTPTEVASRDNHDYLLRLPEKDGTAETTLFIDALKYGNVGRFINHSCEPNLILVRVVDDIADQKTPRAAFFTAREVAAGEELSYDYGDEFWQGKDVACQCGSTSCRFSVLGAEAVPKRKDGKKKDGSTVEPVREKQAELEEGESRKSAKKRKREDEEGDCENPKKKKFKSAKRKKSKEKETELSKQGEEKKSRKKKKSTEEKLRKKELNKLNEAKKSKEKKLEDGKKFSKKKKAKVDEKKSMEEEDLREQEKNSLGENDDAMLGKMEATQEGKKSEAGKKKSKEQTKRLKEKMRFMEEKKKAL